MFRRCKVVQKKKKNTGLAWSIETHPLTAHLPCFWQYWRKNKTKLQTQNLPSWFHVKFLNRSRYILKNIKMDFEVDFDGIFCFRREWSASWRLTRRRTRRCSRSRTDAWTRVTPPRSSAASARRTASVRRSSAASDPTPMSVSLSSIQ